MKIKRPKSLPTNDYNFYSTNAHKLNALKKYQEKSSNSLKPKLFQNFSFVLEPNPKFRNNMEDFINIIPVINKDANKSLFILCDGHGNQGHIISKTVNERLPEIILEKLKNNKEIEKSINECFHQMDCELYDDNPEAGTTVNLVYILENENKKIIYSANVGDSRTVIISENNVTRLSYDHKAKDKKEKKRVCNEGGTIFGGRFYGDLAITRSLGDFKYKENAKGLSHIPHISKYEIKNDDMYLIIASDGLWDVISEEKIFEYLKTEKITDLNEIVNYLLDLALKLGSTDNISIIIVSL